MTRDTIDADAADQAHGQKHRKSKQTEKKRPFPQSQP